MTKTEKPNVKRWIEILDGKARKGDRRQLCKRVSYLVGRPSRRRVSVNLYKINWHTKSDDNIIIPGKVLSTGVVDHSINISALEFSDKAQKMLKESKSKIVDIEEMLGKKNIKIIT